MGSYSIGPVLNHEKSRMVSGTTPTGAVPYAVRGIKRGGGRKDGGNAYTGKAKI